MAKLGELNVLIAGQVITSRTETIEDYLKDKVNYLGIVGISNPFAIKGIARCTLYKNGKRIKELPLLSVQLKGIYWFNQLLMGPVFLLYIFSMFLAVLKLRKKFDIFIGIACFSTLFGILLKQLGIVKHVIYYTLDYYPAPAKLHINTVINKSIWYLDRYCCKQVAMVWNLSPRIPEAREKLMNFSRNRYRHLIVPLTYGEKTLRYRPLEEIETDTLVFVGTLSWNQGLRIVIEAMADLIKIKPALKIRIIGKGPDDKAIKQMVSNNDLQGKFIFHGFIEDDSDVFEIVSRCTVGICTWTNEKDNNVIYADPGKPKLYAFCGIPIVITRVAAVADEIDQLKAGIAIDYDKGKFINAILKVLANRNILEEFRRNAYNFALKYTTENVFKSVDKY
ncbi:MAG: hypothetical protein A2166_02730, partial [Omnitrophica WOR_2 bacterium RBG_13_41_10]